MNTAQHSTNGRSDHETPPAFYWILDQARKFTQDVAASAETAKVPGNYYGLDNGRDGLTRRWSDRWYCNPPYGRQGAIGSWLAKGEEEAAKGSGGAFLIPARLGTSWYWNHCAKWDQWILLGRLTFWVGGRPLDASVGFPSVVVHMGHQFMTGRVHFWDWRKNFIEETRRKKIQIPPGVSVAKLDRLKLIDGRWEYIDPWTRAEALALLAPDKYPEEAARILDLRGWPAGSA